MYIEHHPFQEYIPKEANALIVGSFPPIKLTIDNDDLIVGKNKDLYLDYLSKNIKTDKDINFYYGSKENLFWKLIGASIEKKLNSKCRILNFLKTHKFSTPNSQDNFFNTLIL